MMLTGLAGFAFLAYRREKKNAALPLFATGLGGLGLLGWRRKRKAGGRVDYFRPNNSGSLAMFIGEPRALSRFFIQALIIERASVFASSRVPKTALSTGSLLSGI